jgi:hypothetical protein
MGWRIQTHLLSHVHVAVDGSVRVRQCPFHNGYTYRSGSSPSFSCLNISSIRNLKGQSSSLEVLGVCLVCHLGLVGPDTGNDDTGNTDVETMS